ncbi:DEAD/DEAH box helicase [Tetragenococcus koreensis]|uniref:DEAD/DEAH box helicase n=1 Tax=Tetragenococcus koreensis TaxID=290335 RepID=UPI001F457AEB|nr:DEAD/DEAH box helicase [Tetragenococcus koreensis]MCF1628093.1 DEAD/DEAH box helicase [Tetragenococcus koreensis]
MAQAIFLEKGFYIEQPTTEFEFNLQKQPYQTLYEQGFANKRNDTSPSIDYLLQVAQWFVTELKNNGEIEVTKEFQPPSEYFYQTLAEQVPFVIGYEFVTVSWLQAIHQKLAAIFTEEIQHFSGSVAEYIQSKNADLITAGRVYFHLIERQEAVEPFAFLATYATSRHGKVKHTPLKNALVEFDDTSEIFSLLSAVERVARESDFIAQLMDTGELFSPLSFNEQEAYQFLKETPLYEENGVICRIPDFWKKKQKPSVKVTIGDKKPSKVSMEALLSSQPEMYLGEERYSKAEIEALLQQDEGLAFLKGKWVEVNHEKLQNLLDTFEKQADSQWSLFEAFRYQEASTKPDNEEWVETTHGAWLSQFFTQMTTPQKIEQEKPTNTFQAVLRPYQQIGFNWLRFMQGQSLGALLADDMGLGKTIQILALLDFLRKKNARTLLVIPASLIENWKKETERFAPNLSVKILHGKNIDLQNSSADLFITTYGMVAKIEALQEETFDLLILDEAQAIKNPATKQTKSVKSLNAHAKIAMTGTPIENSLADLWSVFDFLNRGLLGSKKEFKQQSKKGVDYGKLRQLISPFILRRLKTDAQIITDLPAKNEQKEYTGLSKKQVALYKEVQRKMAESLEESEGIQRKGLVLTAISKFKQICNHPDQYLGNQEFKPQLSGKFETLRDICETIRDRHEQVLIFTQFKEMCDPLDDFLAEVFGQKGAVLHGSVPPKKRAERVNEFNDPNTYTPYMVLSIKAGGVGLNLTRANHVIHFDRWWNPAVEDQATDRAFRIGQEKNVFIYKFVTSGTVEEKIDEMLAEKTQLSQDIITETSGESWLTEMSNDELKDLFTLEVEK